MSGFICSFGSLFDFTSVVIFRIQSIDHAFRFSVGDELFSAVLNCSEPHVSFPASCTRTLASLVVICACLKCLYRNLMLACLQGVSDREQLGFQLIVFIGSSFANFGIAVQGLFAHMLRGCWERTEPKSSRPVVLIRAELAFLQWCRWLRFFVFVKTTKVSNDAI